MPSLQQIKQKIATANSTIKITRVMQMVSASKLSKTRSIADSTKLYKDYVLDAFETILKESSCKSIFRKYGFTRKKNALIITVSSDKGLCGSLNSNLCKNTILNISKLQEQGYTTTIKHIGNKATTTFKYKLKDNSIPQFYIDSIYSGVGINKQKLQKLTKDIILKYYNENYTDIFVSFNSFKSAILNSCEFMNIKKFLNETKRDSNYIQVDCSTNEIIHDLELNVLYAILYYIISQNIVCEHSLRMQAMDSATKNTKKVIDHFVIKRNKLRQSSITSALIDVVSSANCEN